MYLVLRRAMVEFGTSGTSRSWKCPLCDTENDDSAQTCWCGGRKR